MRWYKNWCEFRFYKALGKLNAIFILLWIYAFIKYWYVLVPLSVVFLIVALNVGAEEERKQNFRTAQYSAMNDRVQLIVKKNLPSYGLLSVEEYESLIKEYSYVIEQLQNNEVYEQLNRFYLSDIKIRLDLCKDLLEIAKRG